MIEGFRPEGHEAFVAFTLDIANRFYDVVSWFSKHLRVEVKGMDHLPAGRALLVANHTFGWDSILPMAAVWRQLERPVWVLGEHAWWKVPVPSTSGGGGTREQSTERPRERRSSARRRRARPRSPRWPARGE